MLSSPQSEASYTRFNKSAKKSDVRATEVIVNEQFQSPPENTESKFQTQFRRRSIKKFGSSKAMTLTHKPITERDSAQNQ